MQPVRQFDVLKLHNVSETCWAVITPSGAIAQDHRGRLLFRLKLEDARRIADVMAGGSNASIEAISAG